MRSCYVDAWCSWLGGGLHRYIRQAALGSTTKGQKKTTCSGLSSRVQPHARKSNTMQGSTGLLVHDLLSCCQASPDMEQTGSVVCVMHPLPTSAGLLLLLLLLLLGHCYGLSGLPLLPPPPRALPRTTQNGRH